MAIPGYVYCFGNASMPGIYKIGYTEKTPMERLKEANGKGTYSPPTPYTVLFAKHVDDAKNTESVIFKELNEYRISYREFFRCSLERIRQVFDRQPGNPWFDSPQHRYYQPTEPFEGHVYHDHTAVIHGFRLNYIHRELFPPCRRAECPCTSYSSRQWVSHMKEVDQERRMAHNSNYRRPVPRPRKRIPARDRV